MDIVTRVDPNQEDTSIRSNMAVCPACGRKIIEFTLIGGLVFGRYRCKKCKQYIQISAHGKTAG